MLRGRPASDVKFTLDTMVKSLTETNKRNQQLMAELRRRGEEAPAPRVEEAPKPSKPLADRLLEEPEAALQDFFTSRANPVLQEISALKKQIGATQLATIRRDLPDFDEYEDQVMELIGAGPVTQETLTGAYAMAVGLKTIEDRSRASRAAANSPPPPRDVPPSTPKYNKTTLSEEIRVGLGMTEKDYYETYSPSNPNMGIKVKT